jgi:hypothetical protein
MLGLAGSIYPLRVLALEANPPSLLDKVFLYIEGIRARRHFPLEKREHSELGFLSSGFAQTIGTRKISIDDP